ncbi:MAG TPA: hypothetical protein VLT45_30275 [Kofleriaceae bacterium]|nr:hypothetical protein [Kofleriaceae bacterium]
MLERVRALPDVVERAMPAIREGLEAELRAQIARGENPKGTAWKKTQKGESPLHNAAKAITIERNGLEILVTLVGVEARHHYGWVRGGVKRQILPNAGTLSTAFAKVINDALDREFVRVTGGA